ncbi:M28 family peptidase [Granulicella tundricola]|uniref:Peptidase M28 n=1 Tax=Granulicella tundricola (strain ATCC BAA-1859 / DSM 23138 / MP5ACTX9) TaxID=1198114 RepID=E8X124_GRATM|nr:M28 family peptidase [Granulicella tundricola]ADW67890.1 peptidase M28 [Granulicella tundricola MP5ACTX9]
MKKYAVLLMAMVFGAGSAWGAPAKAKVSGAATYALTKEYLAAAPKRFNGSPGHAAAEKFIEGHFNKENADHRMEVDTFTATTPAGMQTMHNIIVKYPGKKDGVIVLGSHYETNYPLKDINFVGANDGACTSALLMEFGEYFRAHPPEGYSVWLVFFDGEEAVKTWGPSDSLYGSRHLAAKWSQDGTLGHLKAFLNADMIGDKDLNIDHDDASTPALLDLFKVAAKNTGHEKSIYKSNTPIQDDTVPFAKRGVPVLDVIDYEYGPLDEKTGDYAYHHTAQDSIDKISAASLQISADLFLEMVHLIDQR